MDQASLWVILESYNIPDVDLLKSLYEHTTVRLPQTDMGSVKITFNTGVDQGSVLSPLLFSLFINALSLYLSEIGRNNNIHHDLPNIDPFNHILVADDMSCFAQNNTGMQLLMDDIQEFEEWSGMPVNTFKTKQMTVDDVRGNRATTEKVTYNKEILLIVPESEPVRYLGFWATPNGNMQAAKDLVYERTLTTKETIRDHPLDPKQVIEIFSAKAIGSFRYLAVVTTWSRRDLNRLDRY